MLCFLKLLKNIPDLIYKNSKYLIKLLDYLLHNLSNPLFLESTPIYFKIFENFQYFLKKLKKKPFNFCKEHYLSKIIKIQNSFYFSSENTGWTVNDAFDKNKYEKDFKKEE